MAYRNSISFSIIYYVYRNLKCFNLHLFKVFSALPIHNPRKIMVFKFVYLLYGFVQLIMMVKLFFLIIFRVWLQRIAVATFKKDVVLFFGFYTCMDEFIDWAAKTPHVRGLIVLMLNQRNFRSTIPPGADMAWKTPFLGQLLLAHLSNFFSDRVFQI